jgi:hypothetical protein
MRHSIKCTAAGLLIQVVIAGLMIGGLSLGAGRLQVQEV